MKICSSLFDLRDKPKNSTAGSSYRFFTGGSTAGKNVIKCSAMPMTERQSNKTQREPLIKWLCYADYQVVCDWCRGSSRPLRTFLRAVLLGVFVVFAGDTMSLLHEIDKSRGA